MCKFVDVVFHNNMHDIASSHRPDFMRVIPRGAYIVQMTAWRTSYITCSRRTKGRTRGMHRSRRSTRSRDNRLAICCRLWCIIDIAVLKRRPQPRQRRKHGFLRQMRKNGVWILFKCLSQSEHWILGASGWLYWLAVQTKFSNLLGSSSCCY